MKTAFMSGVLLVLPLTLIAQLPYQFLPDVRVNQDPAGLYTHFTGFTNGHSIAFCRRMPCVLWTGNQVDGVHPHVYLSRSTDGGASFLNPVRVDNSAGSYSCWSPTLLLDSSGTLYAAWPDSSSGPLHIFLAKSTDGGVSFTAPVRVDSNGGYIPQYPALAIDRSGTLYCTWSGWQDPSYTYSDIYLARSTDGGATFRPAVLVDSTMNMRAAASTITTDSSGDVLLAWRDNRLIGGIIYHVEFCKSSDGGQTFTRAVEVDLPGNYSGTFPCLASDRSGQNLWVAYKEFDTGSFRIYVSKSTDGGQTFGGRIATDSVGWSDTPNLVLSNTGRLFLIWLDPRNGNWGDAYFAYSTGWGASFSTSQKVNTPTGNGGENPNIAYGPGDTLYTCWYDYRNSNSYPDIYFAKGIPPLTGIEQEGRAWGGDKGFSLYPYPNPFTSFATIPGHEAERFNLYDISGRKMGTYFGNSIGEGLVTGVYFLRAEKGDRKPLRIVKVR